MKGTSRITLERTPRDVLEYLVRNPNRLIPYEELKAAVWKVAHVEDASVHTAIAKIRSALRQEEPAADFIENHKGEGVEFRANVEVLAVSPPPAAPPIEARTDRSVDITRQNDGKEAAPEAPGQAILRDLIQRGRVAFLIPEIRRWSINDDRLCSLELNFVNAGNAPAIHPYLTLYAEDLEEYRGLATLLPGERMTVTLSGLLSTNEFTRRNPVLLIRATFTTPEGHLIYDDTNVELAWDHMGDQTEVIMCNYRCKGYIHSSAIKIRTGEF